MLCHRSAKPSIESRFLAQLGNVPCIVVRCSSVVNETLFPSKANLRIEMKDKLPYSETALTRLDSLENSLAEKQCSQWAMKDDELPASVTTMSILGRRWWGDYLVDLFLVKYCYRHFKVMSLDYLRTKDFDDVADNVGRATRRYIEIVSKRYALLYAIRCLTHPVSPCRYLR